MATYGTSKEFPAFFTSHSGIQVYGYMSYDMIIYMHAVIDYVYTVIDYVALYTG